MQLNNLSEQDTNDNENLSTCKYRDVSYFSSLGRKLKLKCLSFFYLNINSLLKNLDDFNHLINDLKLDFDFLCISEPRILKSQSLNINISLQDYLTDQSTTESTSGGVILYINKKHCYKTRLNFLFHESKKLESTFIEVNLSRKSNLIIGRVYRHPCMRIFTFNNHYLNPLLEKLSKDANKTVVLLGDFNINLLNFDISDQINTFLDDLASNSLQPQILLPTRVCENSKTIIDNTFCDIHNLLVKTAISGNISFSISDHFPQCFILPDFFSILYQLNIILCRMTWQTLTKSYFLRIFKIQIGIKFSN